MAQQTKTVTWPYAVKTIAIGGMPTNYTYPYALTTPYPAQVIYAAEIALEIFPPLYTYKPVGLFMHLNYTFDTSVDVASRVLKGVYCRDTPSSYIATGDSTVEKFMSLNVQADSNRNINISLDLSSILTGKATNVVFLRFPPNAAYNSRTGGSPINGDVINIWKLDLTYQTIGIRNER